MCQKSPPMFQAGAHTRTLGILGKAGFLHTSLYRLEHSKRDLTDIYRHPGKIVSPRRRQLTSPTASDLPRVSVSLLCSDLGHVTAHELY